MTIYVTTDSTVETTERYQDNWALAALLRQQRAMWQVTTALLRQQRVVKLKECFNYQDNKRQSASRHQSRQNADPDEEQALSSTMLYEVRESIFICLSRGTSSIVINNVVRGKRVNIHICRVHLHERPLQFWQEKCAWRKQWCDVIFFSLDDSTFKLFIFRQDLQMSNMRRLNSIISWIQHIPFKIFPTYISLVRKWHSKEFRKEFE